MFTLPYTSSFRGYVTIMMRLLLVITFLLPASVGFPAQAAQADSPVQILSDGNQNQVMNPPLVDTGGGNFVSSQSSSGSSGPHVYSGVTSPYMIGSVTVGIILPESDGTLESSSEDWTQVEKDAVVAEIQTGMNKWTTWGGVGANLSFVYDVHADVPTKYEPIIHQSAEYQVWISDVMTNLGYSGGSVTQQVYSYLNGLRTNPANPTDWAFVIFVADSSNDSDGKFSDGRFAFTGDPTLFEPYDPFAVMTYKNGSNGIDNMEWVAARLAGRIFGAASQVSGECSGTTRKFGYLGIANSQCGTGNGSLMAGGNAAPDTTTKQQVGWRDSDSDGKYDPVDTNPSVILNAYTPDPSSSPVLTYTGIAYDNPVSPASCNPVNDSCFSSIYYPNAPAVTNNIIAAVEFNADGGAWQAGGVPTDGDPNFNQDYEGFSFTTSSLNSGEHRIFVRAKNSQNNYSILYVDKVTIIGSPTNDNFANFKTIAALPFVDAINVDSATQEPNDPDVPAPCNLNKGLVSVWYRFTPSVNQTIYMDTEGSDYDTYLAVWRGSSLTGLTLVTCNDDDTDSTSGLTSSLSLNVQANTTYVIEIAQYNGAKSSAQGMSDKPDVAGQAAGLLMFRAFATANFADVAASYWAWSSIQAIFVQGVTSGCSASPLLYCPAGAVTRDQMAIFLLRSKFGGSFTPPPAVGIFTDVPTSYWAAAWIEELYRQGVTTGCSVSPLKYCPTSPVTRDQMAAFLLRSKYGGTYSPPAPIGVFQDVPVSYWAANWIEKLASEGITTGCSAVPKKYCPAATVLRDQMAVFLTRMFAFPAPTP